MRWYSQAALIEQTSARCRCFAARACNWMQQPAGARYNGAQGMAILLVCPCQCAPTLDAGSWASTISNQQGMKQGGQPGITHTSSSRPATRPSRCSRVELSSVASCCCAARNVTCSLRAPSSSCVQQRRQRFASVGSVDEVRRGHGVERLIGRSLPASVLCSPRKQPPAAARPPGGACRTPAAAGVGSRSEARQHTQTHTYRVQTPRTAAAGKPPGLSSSRHLGDGRAGGSQQQRRGWPHAPPRRSACGARR